MLEAGSCRDEGGPGSSLGAAAELAQDEVEHLVTMVGSVSKITEIAQAEQCWLKLGCHEYSVRI